MQFYTYALTYKTIIINQEGMDLKETKEGWLYGKVWREEREGGNDVAML